MDKKELIELWDAKTKASQNFKRAKKLNAHRGDHFLASLGDGSTVPVEYLSSCFPHDGHNVKPLEGRQSGKCVRVNTFDFISPLPTDAQLAEFEMRLKKEERAKLIKKNGNRAKKISIQITELYEKLNSLDEAKSTYQSAKTTIDGKLSSLLDKLNETGLKSEINLPTYDEWQIMEDSDKQEWLNNLCRLF